MPGIPWEGAPVGPDESANTVVRTEGTPPEFAFEHDVDGVRRATQERAIDYPVAVDNDYEIWSAFANHYWPALYFADNRLGDTLSVNFESLVQAD